LIEVVLISGHLKTGKTFVAEKLSSEHKYYNFRTSEFLKKKPMFRTVKSRKKLQQLGAKLDRRTGSKWLYKEVEKLISAGDKKIVVDHIRNFSQLQHFRNQPNWKIIHVHLYGSKKQLQEEYQKQHEEEGITYDQADPIESEEDIEKFKSDADIRINTNRSDFEDTFIRVASRLRIYSEPERQCVDVLIGGQFGSEGKGHIAGKLAKEYDLVIRVGGPNAGHTVSSETGVYTYHQLPSGSKDCKAKILLGPGMTIDKAKLLKEIDQCGIGPDRLCIDPQAMIIQQKHVDQETDMKDEIGSTASGSGAAAAAKILGRTSTPPTLAKDDAELTIYTEKRPGFAGDAVSELEMHYRERKKILLEGTQGSGLSIFNGQYPYVTSRDTNVAGCLAEVGISPKRVRRIIMVVRTTPIRVGNPDGGKFSSGGLKNETTFADIAKSAGLDPDKVTEAEKTSTTNRYRRVGWFDWELFRRSCMINTPTDIVLTFADYLSKANQNARRFEQLKEDTIKFIEEIEHVAQAPVSIINTKFPNVDDQSDIRSMIDRRSW